MGFSESIAAYPDIEALFERALASERGLVLTFPSPAEATLNAGRMNAYRVRLRKENAKTYPADHSMHGSTPYEGIMIRRDPNNRCVVKVEKLVIGRFNMEEL